MTNERESVTRVALEFILLLIYAWNSAPILGTDLSRSRVAVGREFSFPIDFSATKHLAFTSSPSTVKTYPKTTDELLEASRKLATVLLEEHRAYHMELVNSRCRDPRVWKVGNVVFAHRTTKSNVAVNKVGKLIFPGTGPWCVIDDAPGGSYKIQHCFDKNIVDKKHACHLFVYPLELVRF